MNRWYASVNFGLENICAKIIKNHGATSVKTLDSAVIFSCPHEIKNKCINNLFLIIHSFNANTIEDAAKKIINKKILFPKIKNNTFRVIIMERGKLKPLPKNMIHELENKIMQQTRMSTYRANPETEIWLNRRSNGRTYFMVRTQKHTPHEKALKKGELRPDVVEALLFEAGINKNSVVADLFGGWGAIAAGVAESGRYRKIYTGDINPECVAYQKKRLENKNNYYVQKWDAQHTPLADNSVDAIITDPPWGKFEKIEAADFYNAWITEAARILTPDGSLVFLSAAQEEAKQALENNNFSYASTPVKINGKNTFLFSAELNN